MATPSEPVDPTTDPTATRGRSSRLGRVAVVLVLLVIVGLWAYALSPLASRRPPGRLDDHSFADQAETICASTVTNLAALPQAFETATPAERADVVDRSDAELRAMVAELRPLTPAIDTRDGRMVNEWLDDWGVYIGDREGYAARLRNDPAARLYVTEKDGLQITEAIDRFAHINFMDSCATPEDLT